ncbi:hypothetical protein BJ912DRAFT_798362, partial [Pholiota molesta]
AHATMLAAQAPISNLASAQAMAAQGRHSQSQEKCSNPVCGRLGHTIERCFKPGGGMAGQYPDWWKRRGGGSGNSSTTNSGASTPATNIAASAVSDPNMNFAFATSTLASRTGEIITYADSAASGYFFVDHSDFVDY